MNILNHSLHIDYLVSLSVAVASGHTREQHQRHQDQKALDSLTDQPGPPLNDEIV